MNKTKIEWVQGPNGEKGYTWNPVTGCLHGCQYCYARRIAERFGCHCKSDNQIEEVETPWLSDSDGRKLPYPYDFKPTLHKYRLDEPIRKTKPQTIFVCSMADLFGEWVPDKWIDEIMISIAKAPQHKYLFLTKNPDRYFDYFEGAWQDIPEEYDFSKIKFLLGTTITNQDQADDLSEIANNYIDFLSIEPLLGKLDISRKLHHTAICSEEPNLKWVIVGGQTGPGAVVPKKEWVQPIIDQCRAAGVPIFLKENLKWHETIQEFPW